MLGKGENNWSLLGEDTKKVRPRTMEQRSIGIHHSGKKRRRSGLIGRGIFLSKEEDREGTDGDRVKIPIWSLLLVVPSGERRKKWFCA